MPKAIHDQVVVITGASSGIGREAALQFGKRGASVVLAARNETALQEVANEIRAGGGRAYVAPTDVADMEQVEHLATEAINAFARIDTWVNNAAIGMYALVEETTLEEFARILQVNVMGVIAGSKAAMTHMKRQGYGTIINIGSVLSHRSIPLQVAYSASKHAVKGFTEGLRLELRRDYPDIHVTLISPASINTPYFSHARSKLGVHPQPYPPAYPPSLAAESIVHAAEHPTRDIYVGGASMMITLMNRISPTFTDWLMMRGNNTFKLQKTDRPDDGQDSMYQPEPGIGRVEGDFGHLTKPSMYTRIVELTPPWQKALLLPLATGLGMIYLSNKSKDGKSSQSSKTTQRPENERTPVKERSQ